MERGEIQMYKLLKKIKEKKESEKRERFLDQALKEINEARIKKGLPPYESMNMAFFGNERAPMRDVSEEERQALIRELERAER